MIRIPAPRPIARAVALTIGGIACLLAAEARAHFIWITAEAAEQPGQPATIRVFLNEPPDPGGPEFLQFVRGVVPTAGGVPLAATTGAEAVEAPWVGPLPGMIDAERDLGLKAKGDVPYRLYYTARLQAGPVAATAAEKGSRLRARVIAAQDGRPVVQVLYDGKPAPGARIKTYPEAGEGAELVADDRGQVEVAGVAEGKVALWANWTDPTPGDLDGKPYRETRYYATLNCPKAPAAPPSTAFAAMPDPAVNSFGGAVLGDWLYVYSGHVGQTHQYSVETTSKHFRRLSLRDRTTWEDLPMGRDVQGTALVADGRYLYRIGGMTARNRPGQPQDLISVADFARFDPESRAWTDLAPLPAPRSTHDAAVIGRKVYAAGGWSMKGNQATPEYLGDAVAFDLDRPERGWQVLDQPFRRRALAVAEAGGKLYVVGGLDDQSRVTRRVDILDPATGSWSLGPPLPGADRDGFAPSACAAAGHLYASGMGGTIVRLDPARGGWEAVGAWTHPRLTHRVLPGPGRSLLAVGGNARGVQTPAIESVPLPGTPPADAPAGHPAAASR